MKMDVLLYFFINAEVFLKYPPLAEVSASADGDKYKSTPYPRQRGTHSLLFTFHLSYSATAYNPVLHDSLLYKYYHGSLHDLFPVYLKAS